MQKNSISIDSKSGIPLWLQLRNRLIYLITSGSIRKGEKLPTVRSLAVELGINFNTVSKVYRDIERDGYTISRQGAGTFASDGYLHRVGAPTTEADLLIDEFIRQCLELGVPKDDIVGLIIERLMFTEYEQTKTPRDKSSDLKTSLHDTNQNDTTIKRSHVEQ